MGDVMVVTWQSGGAALEAIGLAGELVRRGHQVRVLAPPCLAARVSSTGAEHVVHPPSIVFDTASGRAVEDQQAYIDSVFNGPVLPLLVNQQLDQRTPDVVIVDAFLRSSLDAVAASGLRLAVLVTTARSFCDFGNVMACADLGLVTVPAALDTYDPAAHLVHVGPLQPRRPASTWRSPWPSDDQRPLVVVSLGTTYMHQEQPIRRAAEAARSLGARVLVLTGDELAPDELDVDDTDPDLQIERFAPHNEVLPTAAAIVHHAGMGTTVAALRAGVPSVCLPLGRDQHLNATRSAAAGGTIVVDPASSATEIRHALHMVLNDHTIRNAAKARSNLAAGCGGAERAAKEIETLIATPRPTAATSK